MAQIIYLSRKQSRQIIRMYNEFQSYLPFKEGTFYAFTDETIGFVKELIKHNDEYTLNIYASIFRDNIRAHINKYYIDGFKLNKKIRYYYTNISLQND